MFEADGVHITLHLFERSGLAVVGGDERIDRLPQRFDTGEASPTQRLPGQDTEPNLDLVQPGSVRGREVQVYLGMPPQPASLGLWVFRLSRMTWSSRLG